MPADQGPPPDEVLAALVASLRAELAEARAELERARERIAKLQARLAQNSRNSSKPPQEVRPQARRARGWSAARCSTIQPHVTSYHVRSCHHRSRSG